MHRPSSRRWRAAAAGTLALALALVGCTAKTTFSYTPPEQADTALSDDLVAQMQAAVENAMATTGTSGAVVGVWVPWSGTWVTGIGTQGVGDETPVTTDMSFRIADVTRLMTCDVLYALADEGTVALDAPVTDYVSGVGDMGGATLVQLCDGTSGVGSSESSVQGQWLNTPNRVWAPLELASYGLAKSSGTPGAAFQDSDAGYLILGLALERITGKSASDLIAEYVTEPLGLSNTSLPGTTAAAASTTGAVLKGTYLPAADGGYNCTAPVDITTLSSSTGFTDSGAVSTIEDLGRYIQAEARQGLRASDAEPDRYASPLTVSDSLPSWIQATGGAYIVGSLVGEHGSTPGYSTAAYSDPDTGLTVAVVLNNSTVGGGIISALAWELAAIASKAPAAEGQTAPDFGLPFTADQHHQAITNSAICPAG